MIEQRIIVVVLLRIHYLACHAGDPGLTPGGPANTGVAQLVEHVELSNYVT